MNRATDYKIIAFGTTRKNKMALVKLTGITGQTITHVMNSLLSKYLFENINMEEIRVGEKKRVKK